MPNVVGEIWEMVKAKVEAGVSVEHMDLVDESSQHNVPEGAESHFKLLLVSADFEGLSRVARQRKIYQILSKELAGPVHALSLRLLTKEEWQKVSDFTTPACQKAKK